MKLYIKELMKVARQFVKITEMKKAYTLIYPFVIKYWRAYIVLFFLLLINVFLTIAFARFFGQITDAAIHSHFETLKWLVPLGASLIILNIITDFTNIYYETKTLHGVKKDLKNHFFNHILRLPTSHASNHHSGELISHFTTDIHSIDGLVGSGLLNLIKLPMIYIAVFIYLSHINITLSLISIGIAPIAMVSAGVFGILLRRNGQHVFSLNGKINTLLSETFQGFMMIRSFTMEKRLYHDYANKNEELYELEMENAKLQGWYYSGGQLVSSLSFIISLCLGALYVSNHLMTIGALMTFINLVHHLVYPLTGMASQWVAFQRSLAALDRVLKVLDKPVDSIDLPDYAPTHTKQLAIDWRQITFSYDGTHQVFRDFNLFLPSGKVIAFVGPSGAGKSTLFNLLQGYYKPQMGDILINDNSLESYSLSELRSMIATVPQEIFLFAGSIRENLLLVRPGITDQEMVEAAKRAYIHDFILGLPEGYDTEIGERGVKLSGGQKQRLAIARALLKDAPILLLDEATSALDNETEYHVKEALQQVMKGRTTLVIAHRLSTIQHADIIVVLDRGNIVQMGSHDQLVKENGMYKQLVDTPNKAFTQVAIK